MARVSLLCVVMETVRSTAFLLLCKTFRKCTVSRSWPYIAVLLVFASSYYSARKIARRSLAASVSLCYASRKDQPEMQAPLKGHQPREKKDPQRCTPMRRRILRRALVAKDKLSQGLHRSASQQKRRRTVVQRTRWHVSELQPLYSAVVGSRRTTLTHKGDGCPESIALKFRNRVAFLMPRFSQHGGMHVRRSCICGKAPAQRDLFHAQNHATFSHDSSNASCGSCGTTLQPSSV